MNRRSFLQRAALAVSALAIDPERLLWQPGKRTIFVPPAPKFTFRAEAFVLDTIDLPLPVARLVSVDYGPEQVAIVTGYIAEDGTMFIDGERLLDVIERETVRPASGYIWSLYESRGS